MNRLAYPQHKQIKYFIVAGLFIVYEVIFVAFHHDPVAEIAALSIIPVFGASWYFEIGGGILVAILTVLFDIVILAGEGGSPLALFESQANLIGTFVLMFTAVFVGRLATVTRERHEALLKLKSYEQEQIEHSNFLESLNRITGTALEADNLDSILKILAEGIGKLFEADDCFFSLWDETKGTSIPVLAYGSMSDIYPYMLFEPDERTLAASVMEAGHSIPVSDLENSAYVSPKIASLFPSRSMIGIPFIVQDRKLGALFVGYNENHSFAEDEIDRAGIIS